MIRNLINRIKSDKGNAVIVLGLSLIVATLLVGGMIVDLSKAHQLKSSYTDAAQKASQIAIRQQSTKGYLTPNAAVVLVDEYENNTRKSVFGAGYIHNSNHNNDKTLARCTASKPRTMRIYMSTEKATGSNKGTLVGTVNLNTTRGVNVPRSTTNQRITWSRTPQQINDAKFTSINIELKESTPNVIMPAAFAASSGSKAEADAIMCQELGVKAGASIFTGTGSYK